ncbi:hypothetical protein ONN26_25965, partial [Salmonella enterica subsp. enterica serovar Muenster]|nr:hypothetical protein [Salmonella enterica subsp. enterica serovar Muenster]
VLEEEKEVQYKRSYLYFWLPESLLVEGNQNVEARKIGIYQGQDEVAASEGFLKQPAGKEYAFAGPSVKDKKYFGDGTGVGLRK